MTAFFPRNRHVDRLIQVTIDHNLKALRWNFPVQSEEPLGLRFSNAWDTKVHTRMLRGSVGMLAFLWAPQGYQPLRLSDGR